MDLLEYAGISKNIKNTNIGISYLGSKRKISYDILSIIASKAPHARYFFDLFGGGGAMSFNARANGYEVYYNELDTNIYMFVDFIVNQKRELGKYGYLPDSFYRFVSREDFKQLKQAEPSVYRTFALINYSFGCNCGEYFCSKDKEIFKKAGHYFILDNDKDYVDFYESLFKDSGSCSGVYRHLNKEVFPSMKWQDRRLLFVDLTLKMEAIGIGKVARLFQKGSDRDTFNAIKNISQRDLCRLIDKHNPVLPKKNYKGTQGKGLIELKQLERLEQLQQLQQLQQLEQLGRLGRLEQLQQLQRLGQLQQLGQLEQLEQLQQLQQLDLITPTNLDYAEVKISTPPNDTIIYADPPYKDTNGYNINKESAFNYDRFYDYMIWLHKQGYNVFISEYNMPQDRFKEVWSKNTYANFNVISRDCGARAKPQRVERLFMVR